jgi:hypothetical protein
MISGLSAQERPVLNDSIVRNFVENLEAMDTAFSDIIAEEDFSGFAESMDEFQGSLAGFLYEGGVDFPAFRTAFIRVKSVRAPSVERVFSDFGLGQKGIEVFFVITLGMTIGFMETEIENALSNIANSPDLSEELAALKGIQDKLAMMRSLIQPDDMAVLDKNMDMFFELF